MCTSRSVGGLPFLWLSRESQNPSALGRFSKKRHPKGTIRCRFHRRFERKPKGKPKRLWRSPSLAPTLSSFPRVFPFFVWVTFCMFTQKCMFSERRPLNIPRNRRVPCRPHARDMELQGCKARETILQVGGPSEMQALPQACGLPQDSVRLGQECLSTRAELACGISAGRGPGFNADPP